MATKRQGSGSKAGGARRRVDELGRMTKADLVGEVRRLDRRIRRVESELEAERASAERRIAAARRGVDRRLTLMMREIASLRHHEARAAALERMLAERDDEQAGDTANAS